jgi:glutaconyl-CoA/methylmalonyl-CoA decarboxylase subunit gamma
MSLYYVTIGNNEYRVHLNGTQAMVNGKPVTGHLQALNGSGLHLLQRDRQALELYLNAQDGDNLEVLVGSRRMLARVETLQRHLSRRSVSAQNGILSAPMPGLVVSVHVKEGDMVEEGQTLVVLESMKMQMQLRAPGAGRAQSVAVRAGDQVEKGIALVHIASADLKVK